MDFKKTITLLCLALAPFLLSSQGSPNYQGGLKVKLNEEGTKYFRLLSWGQFWAQYSDDVPEDSKNTSLSIRRARLLMFAQITDKFMILTHFGLNSLNANNLTPTGQGSNSQLFLHDMWGEYKLSDNHSAGIGLHYWNGISRLNNQSTLNMLTLDNNRQSWATLGLSDQFARHIGVYAKGALGKLQYRIAINEAETNNLDTRDPTANAAIYAGRRILGSANAGYVYQGYFDYHFFDQESNFLPYKVGSYLGGKKVFNLGAGFFHHPNGAVILSNGENQGEDVSIFGFDVFYDAPVNDKGDALTAYAVYQLQDYGTDFELGSTYGSGNMFYTHAGYYMKSNRLQPYLSYQNRAIDALDDNANVWGLGSNYYIDGHNAKLSFEYKHQKIANNDGLGVVTLQAMIYL